MSNLMHTSVWIKNRRYDMNIIYKCFCVVCSVYVSSFRRVELHLGMLKLFYFLIWMYVNKIGIYLDILSSWGDRDYSSKTCWSTNASWNAVTLHSSLYSTVTQNTMPAECCWYRTPCMNRMSASENKPDTVPVIWDQCLAVTASRGEQFRWGQHLTNSQWACGGGCWRATTCLAS